MLFRFMKDEFSEEDMATREREAYIAMHPMLKEQYMGQHVAIFEGQLIDIDTIS